MPRQQDPVWKFFNRIKKDNNSGPWAVCKKCDKQMQGIVERLRKHYEECYARKVDSNSDADTDSVEVAASASTSTSATSSNQAEIMNTASSSKTQIGELLVSNKDNGTEEDNSHVKRKQEFDIGARKRRTTPSVRSVNIAKDSDVIVTSEAYKKKIDEQLGRYFLPQTPHSVMLSMRSLSNCAVYSGPVIRHQIAGVLAMILWIQCMRVRKQSAESYC